MSTDADRFNKTISEMSNPQIESLIDTWIHSERDRKILKRRLIDRVHYEDLSYEFDISARYIKEIVYKSENVLKKHLLAF